MFSLKLQEFIHRFEVGAGSRFVRLGFTIIAFLGVAVVYDVLAYRNLATSEAMDAAQVGLNLAEGKGFTTSFIRPFSVYLLQQHRADHGAMLNGDHPDLANPPIFPALLAAVLKFVPAQDFTAPKEFTVARYDLVIAVFNQVLLFVGAILVYVVGSRWFDRAVGTLAAILFALNELYWRFSVSGLSTIFLIDLILVLALLLTSLEQRLRADAAQGGITPRSALVGVVVGVACLTRYSCGWLLVPVLVFLAAFVVSSRWSAMAAALVGFLVVISPWIVRNVVVSGTPFGTAGFAAMELTAPFPEDRLQRSLSPDLGQVAVTHYVRKCVSNLRDIMQSDLPKSGGNWLWALFLAGLLVAFQNQTLKRMRWFLIAALVVFTVIQAIGKTQLAAESPEVNSENLLVVLSPLVLIFGTGVFFVLLDGIVFPSPPLRYAAISTFAVIVSLPLFLAVLPPHPVPLVYPPYYPPRIQQLASLLGEREMLISDVPWAGAWYGRRQSMLLTLTAKEDFFRIHDFVKPISGLYLTTRTTEKAVLGNWVRGEADSWGHFLLEALVRQQLPAAFPLRHAPEGFVREGQLLLMDRERWKNTAK